MARADDPTRGGGRVDGGGAAGDDDAASAAEEAEVEEGDRGVEEEAGLGVVPIPPSSEEAGGER
jgi:hypothetical protein